MVRLLIAFAVAVVVTVVLGCFSHTQFVLAALEGVGYPIPLADRLSTTLFDLTGLAPTYGAVVAIGFLIAFSVAAGIIHFVPGLRTTGYVLAGAVAIVVALTAMSMMFWNITPIAGARGFWGMSGQAVAGGLGGYLFATLSSNR